MVQIEPVTDDGILIQIAADNPDRSLRALLLLEAIATADAPLSLAQLSDRLDAPKATLLRMLVALERLGFVLREVDEKAYLLGPRANRLGLSLLRNEVVLQRSRLILQTLVGQLGETCNLTAMDADSVIYIDRVETSSPCACMSSPAPMCRCIAPPVASCFLPRCLSSDAVPCSSTWR